MLPISLHRSEGVGFQLIRLERPAMGSLFEIFLGGDDTALLERLANEALDRVEWLEGQLSHYLPESEICQINAQAFRVSVDVSSTLMTLLLRLRRWSEVTEGALDCTAGKLVRLWGQFRRGQAHGSLEAPPD